ncbi:alpha/beta hydrolase [Streptomyces profundus]|uniref:alpha/beta hydrolase n=1 Tax=Streptomyces profundus TaxID=2867410 RepID=UPI001D169112|nr:alpha/beta hydrolase [Streptomyces sp. MA3_2.13]UED83817.1 alpha/beta hydrolase [Streptomyces sp. MA3_2.13]
MSGADPGARRSRPDRTAAYDNNAAVADSAALVRERDAASAAYRSAHPHGLDIPYGERERNRVDLYRGAHPEAPCLVFLHGGYWQRNGREGFAAVAAGVRRHGWSAALPGYTLAPAASLTEIVAEVRLALDWLTANGPAHGIAGPLLLAGWSAGAQLAALVLDHPGVRAGLAISGVYELGPLRDTALNEALALTDDEVARLSPLRLPPVPKPLTIAHGTGELPALVADAEALARLRAAAGAPGDLMPIRDRDHFTVLGELASPDGALTRAALAALAS